MKSIKHVSQIFKVCLFCGLIAWVNLSAAETISDFSSDGCSRFPDGTLENGALWCDCCITHDKAYWQGGTALQKFIADKTLRDCVLEKTANILLADAMYYGVTLGGSPLLPTDYRWGYGWNYGRSYQALTANELQQVKKKLHIYQQSVTGRECPFSVFELPLWFHKL